MRTETLIAEKMTFATFMERALYGPEGYYSAGRASTGKTGDYFTAPEVGPVFGQLLAAIFQSWQERTQIDPFRLVEVGAGDGALAQILTTLLPAAEFPYVAVERSAARRAKLEGIAPAVSKLGELKPFAGCLFGNELLDAFPVHRVRMHRGRLEEAYVRTAGGQPTAANARVCGRDLTSHDWILEWGDPSTPKLATYLERIGVEWPEHYETEINLAMADWFAAAAHTLDRGLLLLIDYGRPAHDYYAPERDRGTLRAFKGHHVFDPFAVIPALPPERPCLPAGRRPAEGRTGLQSDPGRSPRFRGSDVGSLDVTADVDFTSAAWDARANGLEPLAFMELGTFLLEGAERLSKTQEARPGTGVQRPSPVALQYLLHPEGMGAAFHVLVLGKNSGLTAADFPHNRIKRLALEENAC